MQVLSLKYALGHHNSYIHRYKRMSSTLDFAQPRDTRYCQVHLCISTISKICRENKDLGASTPKCYLDNSIPVFSETGATCGHIWELIQKSQFSPSQTIDLFHTASQWRLFICSTTRPASMLEGRNSTCSWERLLFFMTSSFSSCMNKGDGEYPMFSAH